MAFWPVSDLAQSVLQSILPVRVSVVEQLFPPFRACKRESGRRSYPSLPQTDRFDLFARDSSVSADGEVSSINGSSVSPSTLVAHSSLENFVDILDRYRIVGELFT